MVEFYKSRYTPGVTGSEILWKIGDRAVCGNMKDPADNGKVVIVKSGPKSHTEAPEYGMVLEVTFEGDEQLYAVLADNLRPVD